jgi:hypothetical protein|tara:strand:- start:2744 stop:2908 length:165 start_codon:yes stop_codon:yes gene_type:complete
MKTTNLPQENILEINNKDIQLSVEQKNPHLRKLFGKLKDWNINGQDFKDKTRNE